MNSLWAASVVTMTLNDRTSRTSSRILMALPIAALAFSLAACGGAARPSADDVADGIQQVYEDQGLGDVVTDDVAQCFAEKLVDSDLSNETLGYIANGEDKQANEKEKDLTTKILRDNVEECGFTQ
ncbi:hypothetical protein RN50_01274 [Microbacterium foliorum]|uniref:Uncharacterized protein n=2 Tax=Microbacterium foliorum TaxID=104336 RepID=A0A0F0KQE9_9MICO|nr:hypothetical protein RN50_01274 [Microbacterium foliorum]